jgi:hypothetical protein
MPHCRSILQGRRGRRARRQRPAQRRLRVPLRGERPNVAWPSRSASSRGCRLSRESVRRAQARLTMTRRSAVQGQARRLPRAPDRQEDSCSQTTARLGKPPASCLPQTEFSSDRVRVFNRGTPVSTRFPLIGWAPMQPLCLRCAVCVYTKIRKSHQTRGVGTNAADLARRTCDRDPRPCHVVPRFSRTAKRALATVVALAHRVWDTPRAVHGGGVTVTGFLPCRTSGSAP